MSQQKTIPERSAIPQPYTWNTADLYPSDQAWQEDFVRLQDLTARLAEYEGRLGGSAAVLYDFLTLEQEAGELLVRLMDYAQRRSDEDTRVPEYQAKVGRITTQYVELSRATAFEVPELLRLADQTLEEFYRQEPRLELFRRYLHNIQRRRAHTLSDCEERLLAAAGELAQSPDDIFSKLSDADLTFPDAVDGQGGRHPLSNGSFTLLMSSEDRALRRSAFQNLYAVYGGVKNTLAATLNAQVKQLQFFSSARRYPSALAASLDGTHVPVEVYHNLISTVRSNLDKMHRYVRLRKKLLGLGGAALLRCVRSHGLRGGRQNPLCRRPGDRLSGHGPPWGASIRPSSGRGWTAAGSMSMRTRESGPAAIWPGRWSTPISCSTIRMTWTVCSPWPMSWATRSTPIFPTGRSPQCTGTM